MTLAISAGACSGSGRPGDTSSHGAGPITARPDAPQASDPAPPDAPSAVDVAAGGETQPVLHSGDAADDPAIWVDLADPEQSLILGNDKQGALETYDLDGTLHQRLTSATTFWGNVDVRQQVQLAGRTVDVVAAANGGVGFWSVDAETRDLVSLTGGQALETGGGEGLCLYDAGPDGLYVFMVLRTGEVRQFEVQGAADGEVSITSVRTFEVGSESEGCVVDDDRGVLYVAEEDVGLWRYGADPTSGSARELVDAVAPQGHQTGDIEGLTLVDSGNGAGLLLSSSQAPLGESSYFSAFDRGSGSYVGSFRITDGPAADGCSHTDGIAATTTALGPSYPDGVFVCQDDRNTAPGSAGDQDFKLTSLRAVLQAVGSP